MTYADLLSLIRILLPETYDTAVPAGKVRYIVLHRYGANSVYGSNSNVFDFPRVHIDVYTQGPEDALPGLVRQILRLWNLPYTVQGESWDDDTALYRTILQTEVLE